MTKKELEQIYIENKSICIGFLTKLFKNALSQDEKETIYTEAVMVLYENALNGSYKGEGKISTYLNSVCRNMAYTLLKGRGGSDDFEWLNDIMETSADDKYDYDKSISDQLEEIGLNNPYEEMLNKALNELQKTSERCYDLIVDFYYNKLKLNELQIKYNYSSYDIVKTQKARCLKKLKEIAAKLG